MYTEVDRQSLIALLRKLESPIYWEVFQRQYKKMKEFTESSRTAMIGVDHTSDEHKSQWREWSDRDAKFSQEYQRLVEASVIEQRDAKDLLEGICPSQRHRMPLAYWNVLESLDPIATAQGIAEALGAVMSLATGSAVEVEAEPVVLSVESSNPPPPQLGETEKPNTEPAIELSTEPADDATKVTWQQVAERLECLRLQGEKCVSRREHADRFGCSPATVQKAIRSSPELITWDALGDGKTVARAQSLTPVVLDNRPEQREAKHVESYDNLDEMTHLLIQHSDSDEERAWIRGLSPEGIMDAARIRLADPDKHERILGRRA